VEHSRPKRGAEPTDPALRLDCPQCRVHACLARPGEVPPPRFCPSQTYPQVLVEAGQAFADDPDLRRLALEAARTEAAGYCQATRVEEIMDFARRMGWRHLGIAHCIGLSHEAAAARDVFQAGGLEVSSVCCKCGSADKTVVGLGEAEKVSPGEFEPLCNPVGQAALLAEVGTQFNVVIGLCVGHDSMFFRYSHAPVTVLVAKDRVLGHNPVAALYTSHSYYRRLKQSGGEA